MSTVEDILASEGIKEIVVELDSAARSDGSARTWYYSTLPRATGAGETPANTVFEPYVNSLGPLSQALSEDLLSGLGQISPGALTLLQQVVDEDQLSQLNDYTFAGREVRVRIGLAESATYSDSTFPRYRTFTCGVEPSVELTAEGITASFPLASATDRLLKENLITKRYKGIPHAAHFLTSTGVVTRAHNAAHSLTTFTAMVTFKTPSSASGNTALFRKQSSITNCNWSLRLLTSGAISGVSSTGGAQDVLIESATSYADGAWHVAVLSRSASFAYLMVDGKLIGTHTPAGTADTPASTIEIGSYAGTDRYIQDVRLYGRYMSPDEARTAAATRSEGTEPGTALLYRFDDNTGTSVNDYSSNNLDGTFAGTQNVDWKWDYSDLGGPELAGKPYPIGAGELVNAEAALIDTSRQRYRANIDAVDWHTSINNTTLQVKSRGTVLTGGGTDYTAPSDGGDGVFSTTASEDQPITFNLGSSIVGSGPTGVLYYDVAFLPTVGYNLLAHRTELGPYVDTDQAARLTALCPWRSGYRTEVETTAGQALSDLFDKSGIAYHETVNGELFFDTIRPPMNYGPYGTPCFDFRGETDVLNFGDTADISGSCTVACWFRAHVVSQNMGQNVSAISLISKALTTTSEYALYVQLTGDHAGKLVFRIGAVDSRSPAGLLTRDEWYFVAAVFDDSANTVKLYIAPEDGTLTEVASLSNSGTPVTTNNNLMVGGSNGHPWGAIQHAQVWNVTKTLGQLQTLMGTPPVGTESNLVFYAPLNEGSGVPVNTVSGTPGTLTTTVGRWAPHLTVDLDVTPSVKLTEFHRLDPAYSIIVKHSKNLRPMQPSEIDTGVSQAAAILLKEPWGGEASIYDQEILDDFPRARRIVLESSLVGADAAQGLVLDLKSRFNDDRWIGKLTFPPGLDVSARACGLRIGDEIGISATVPSQLLQPRSFRVIAVVPNPLELSTTVVFWG